MDVVERVRRFAAEHRMFRRTTSILVAVSGGADSVAALLILLDLREAFGFDVLAAHFDHKLRGGSGEDRTFVRELCEARDVRFISGEGDVAGAARAQGMSVEAAGRKARYEFLAFAAGKEHAGAIATGHTMDDQAETVLQRILRGTGVRGLRGMAPVAPVPGAEAQRLVRPLLCLRRQDTVGLCLARGVTPMVDPSNEDVSIQRNRIRHEVLPLLRELNPSVDEGLVRLADHAREAFAPVEESAHLAQPEQRGAIGSVFGMHLLRSLASEARGLVIEREASFHNLRFDVNETRLRNLDDVLRSGSGQVQFGEVVVEASCGRVRAGPALGAAPVPETVLNVPGVAIAGDWRVTVSTEPLPPKPGAAETVIALSRVRGVLRVRRPRADDRVVRPDGARRVRALLANAKIPAWERRAVLVVLAGESVVGLLGAGADLLPPVAADDALYVRAERIPR